MKILIQTIPHGKQAYPTVGNYWVDPDGTWQIRVSDMKDWRHEVLVAVHELVEKCLCHKRHITDADITAFDERFESDRKAGAHGPSEEPGDDPRAPYRAEHFFATNVERLLAAELSVDWQKYSTEVESL